MENAHSEVDAAVSPPAGSAPGTQREALAASLKELAVDPRFEMRHDDLGSLADALVSPEQGYAGWEDVDLFASFSPSSTVNVPRPAVRDRILGAVAGFAIFIPVAWTWWSLRAATETYREVGAEERFVGDSFLHLWSTGFNGELASVHSLPAVAIVSVLVIAVAASTVVAQRLIADRDVDEAMAEQADAEARLVSVMTRVRRHMSVSQTMGDDSFEAMVRRSAARLAEAHRQSEEAAHALRKAAGEVAVVLGAAMDRMDGSLQSMDRTALRLAAAAEAADAAAAAAETTVRESASQLEQGLSEKMQRYEELSADHVERLRQAGEASAKRLHDMSADAVREALDSVTTVAGSVRESARLLQTDVANLAGEFGNAVEGLESATRTMGSLPDRVGQGVGTSMQTPLVELSSSVHGMSRQTGSLEDSATRIRETLDRIDGSLLANQSAIQAQVGELTRTRDLLEQIWNAR